MTHARADHFRPAHRRVGAIRMRPPAARSAIRSSYRTAGLRHCRRARPHRAQIPEHTRCRSVSLGATTVDTAGPYGRGYDRGRYRQSRFSLRPAGGKPIRYGVPRRSPGLLMAPGTVAVSRGGMSGLAPPRIHWRRRQPNCGPHGPPAARKIPRAPGALVSATRSTASRDPNEPHTIGQAFPTRCTRMNERKVKDFYERVRV